MRTLPLVIIAFLLMSFTIKDKGFLIKGTTKNIPEGEMIYLKVLDPQTNNFNAIDSVQLRNNSFEFEGNTTYPTYALLELSENVTELVVLENGIINFQYDYNDDLSTSTIGTKNNNELNAFHNNIKRVQKEANAYRDANQDILTQAIKDNDREILERLSNEFKVYVKNINDIITDQLTQHSNSFTSSVILFQRLDNKNIDPNEAKSYYNQLADPIKKSNIGVAIKNLLDNSSVSTLIKVGDKALDISGEDPNGKTISLFESLGEITLVHFWAPWCPACHETLPIIKSIYEKYHTKGLNIFSIALDDNKEEWVESIQKEDLNWLHISNLYEIQMQYGVKNIPTVFILDKNGTVIDINHLEINFDTLLNKYLE
ncbi:TlpA disulfide reductase family protein [Myroides odoratimimus]|uniref:TlpA disulfide reductase family protein n=1 Tax=Myroides odoratimimus TaxID=76832 RepID=UPI0031011215